MENKRSAENWKKKHRVTSRSIMARLAEKNEHEKGGRKGDMETQASSPTLR